MWAGFVLAVAAFGACVVAECEDRAEGHICDTSGVADTALLRVDVESATPEPTEEPDMYAPTAAPTSAPTPAPSPPTSVPTPAPPAASATGDPHLVNVAGQRFDLRQPGEHILLRLPQDRTKAAHLKLRAETVAIGAPCDMFIVNVSLSGLWIGNLADGLRIRAGEAKPAGTEDRRFFAIQLSGSSLAWTPPTSFPRGGVVLSEHPKGLNGSATVTATNSGSASGTFVVHVGAAEIEVKQKRDGFPFLNIQVKDIGRLGHAAIGGLLGMDNHDAVEAPTDECRAKGGRHTSEWRRAMEASQEQSAGFALARTPGWDELAGAAL